MRDRQVTLIFHTIRGPITRETKLGHPHNVDKG